MEPSQASTPLLPPSDLVMPTPGRIVWYYPVDNPNVAMYDVTVAPLVCVRSTDNSIARVDGVALCLSSAGAAQAVWQVLHKSITPQDENGNYLTSYWDWPVLN